MIDKKTDDGGSMVEGVIALNNVPEDLEIYLKIFTGGITFDDGTIERYVSASDFNEYGEYRYRFIRAPGAYSGNCHNIKFSQDGVLLKKIKLGEFEK